MLRAAAVVIGNPRCFSPGDGPAVPARRQHGRNESEKRGVGRHPPKRLCSHRRSRYGYNTAMHRTRSSSSHRRLAPLLALVLLLAAACSPTGAAPSNGSSAFDLSLYSRVIGRVESDYVVPVDRKKLLEDGLKGMVSGLDPHSDYLNEEEYQELIS